MGIKRFQNRKLLVSVFNAQEAREAVLGGARIVDSEDPKCALFGYLHGLTKSRNPQFQLCRHLSISERWPHAEWRGGVARRRGFATVGPDVDKLSGSPNSVQLGQESRGMAMYWSLSYC